MTSSSIRALVKFDTSASPPRCDPQPARELQLLIAVVRSADYATFSFETFLALVRSIDPAVRTDRCWALFNALPQGLQARAWEHLRLQTERERETRS